MLHKKEGQFTWDNSGASLEFTAWDTKQPDDWQKVGGEDCAALEYRQKEYHWNDMPCSGLNESITFSWGVWSFLGGYPLCQRDTTPGIETFFLQFAKDYSSHILLACTFPMNG